MATGSQLTSSDALARAIDELFGKISSGAKNVGSMVSEHLPSREQVSDAYSQGEDLLPNILRGLAGNFKQNMNADRFLDDPTPLFGGVGDPVRLTIGNLLRGGGRGESAPQERSPQQNSAPAPRSQSQPQQQEPSIQDLVNQLGSGGKTKGVIRVGPDGERSFSSDKSYSAKTKSINLPDPQKKRDALSLFAEMIKSSKGSYVASEPKDLVDLYTQLAQLAFGKS